MTYPCSLYFDANIHHLILKITFQPLQFCLSDAKDLSSEFSNLNYVFKLLTIKASILKYDFLKAFKKFFAARVNLLNFISNVFTILQDLSSFLGHL